MKITGINPYFDSAKVQRQRSAASVSLPALGAPVRVLGASMPENYRAFPENSAFPNSISFTRRLQEHRSWGGFIDPDTKEVSFKIFTFPDAKDVEVKVFSEDNPNDIKTYPMISAYDDGVFETLDTITKDDVKEKDRYYFVITKANGETERVKDPYARMQKNGTKEGFLDYSILYDHSKYEWKNNRKWRVSPRRIKRTAGKKDGAHDNSIRKLNIYELHIDTFTQEGSYEAAKEKLKRIKDLGFNTIELMPNENTFSYNWGYDGVDKFAPQEHRGGPDKLKELIDYAHGLELNVIMDYVPNHLGPDGAQLKRTGPYTNGNNAFGEAFNFQGENSKYVRDYIVNAGMNWIDNYKVDGLRLDMTKFMDSDFTMKEIAAEINYHFPEAFLIAEDSRQNVNANDDAYWSDSSQLHDKRVVRPLRADEDCRGKDEGEHVKYIDTIDDTVSKYNENSKDYNPMLRNLGYDSEWDFSFHHALKNAFDNQNNYEWLLNAVFQSQYNVKYTTSHDETGNNDGTRTVVKNLASRFKLWDYVSLNKKDEQRARELYSLKKDSWGISKERAGEIVKGQKAQLAAETLARQYASGELEAYRTKPDSAFYNEVLKPLDISPASRINYSRLEAGIKRSIAKVRASLAFTYAVPGPKMVFQGEENIDLTPFRFFRKFENPRKEKYLDVEKGYKSGKAALEASILGKASYAGNYKVKMDRFERLTRDLNLLNAENPAFTEGNLIVDKSCPADCLLAKNITGLHVKNEKGDNEFFVVTNFGDERHNEPSYDTRHIHFPEGLWKEVLNTDDAKYGGTGQCVNKKVIESSGFNGDQVSVKIGESSTIYFKRIG